MAAAALAAATALLAIPEVARAQVPSTDPEVGSPSEQVYGIPLEEARRDAAPRDVPSSAIRTENTGGSSARVPGRRGSLVDDADVDSKELAERRRQRRREAVQVATRLSGDPSAPATALLLVLVILLAAGGGWFAGRSLSWRPGP